MSEVDDPILRMPATKKATGLSRSTLYRMIAAGEFPEAAKIGAQAVGWPLSVINAWRVARGLPPTGVPA
jgi:prophage regulatory protein